jgi:hypothetical protein
MSSPAVVAVGRTPIGRHGQARGQPQDDDHRRRDPAPSSAHSRTVGPDGPILLQDDYLIQKMAQFNLELPPSGSCTPRVPALTASSSAPSPFTNATLFHATLPS